MSSLPQSSFYGRKRKRSILPELRHPDELIRYKDPASRERFMWRNIIRPDENNLRRWEEMYHEILVNIMKRISLPDWGRSIGALKACKSWLMAALDVFFPSHVIDLRPHADAIAVESNCRIIMVHVTLANDFRPLKLTELLFPKKCLPDMAYPFFARRLPSLRRFELPAGADFKRANVCSMVRFSCWRNLEEVRLPVSSLHDLATHYKRIHTLRLFGAIGNSMASVIAKNFPLLKHLEIPYCFVSDDALSIMLDCHKSLITLDARHCCCVDEKYIPKLSGLKTCDFETAMHPLFLMGNKWKEDEILQKAAGIKKLLRCGGINHCSQCLHLSNSKGCRYQDAFQKAAGK
ncbi:hypothetical protein CCACVL1_15387 [Corchorus capsularis]|uniref:F-box domain-containing protein n=1 Tax=Corchorus capsularis TaxID=210143 RepID=A0A1R3I2K4_COCAP|nr:hypothetical protein CCACVL1_15387 [Corchorus capsularis]